MLVDVNPFVQQMREENRVLRKTGASLQADAREGLLEDLELFFEELETQTVDAATAAKLAGVNVRTVHRAAARGEIEDLRSEAKKGAPLAVRLRDVGKLRGRGRSKRRGRVDLSKDISDTLGHFKEMIAKE